MILFAASMHHRFAAAAAAHCGAIGIIAIRQTHRRIASAAAGHATARLVAARTAAMRTTSAVRLLLLGRIVVVRPANRVPALDRPIGVPSLFDVQLNLALLVRVLVGFLVLGQRVGGR